MWEAQRRIGAREFYEWIAYERLEVRESERADWRTALSTAQIINYMLAINGSKRRVKPADMLLRLNTGSERKIRRDPQKLKTNLMAWKAAVNSSSANKRGK